MNKSVLVLAAHPDDEVLGCGGAILYHQRQAADVYVCIVTDGSSTQYQNNKRIAKQKDKECLLANNLLGVKKVYHLPFVDMKLDTIPQVKLNQALEEICSQVKPEIIYTHSPFDVNKDHTCVYESSMVITRGGKPYLRKIYCYEVLSSTEWSRKPFMPTTFLDITNYLEKKIKAFNCYKTEIRHPPHPRNGQGILTLAKYRGLQAGFTFAEAFWLMKEYQR